MSLTPGKKYFLKWTSTYPNKPNKIQNMIILECKFIKYNDFDYDNYNEYVKLVEEFDPQLHHRRLHQEENRNVPIELRSKFIGNLLDQSGNFIKLPFDHPLAPYKSSLSDYYLKTASSKRFGFFQIFRIHKIIYNGKKINNKDYYKHIPTEPTARYDGVDELLYLFIASFTKFNSNIHCESFTPVFSNRPPKGLACHINTRNNKVKSTIWVDLEHVKILEDTNQRVTHYHTLNQLEPRLGHDATGEIAKFVGSREYLSDLKKKGGKKYNKSRKANKSKMKRNKHKTKRRNRK